MFWKDDLKDIYEKLLEEGHITYFSTSTVRNILLKVPVKVYNIFTAADLITLARLFETEFPGKTDYDAELRRRDIIVRFKCFKFPSDLPIFDILKKESLRELFTFETLYFDPQKEAFLDPLESYYNIRERKIMPAPNFSEVYKTRAYKIFDALCLACQFDFIIPQEVAAVFQNTPFVFSQEHSEYLRNGIECVLTSKNPHMAITYMDRFNILTEIFPELIPTKSVFQDKDYHPEGNVYEHTLECFKYVKKPSLPLALALLLHDAGKPETAVFKKNFRFPGHSQAGASIARKVLRRLGYKDELIEKVTFLIKYHLLGHEFRKINDRQKAELMNNRMFPDLLKLYRADILSCYGHLSDYKKISTLYQKLHRS